MLLYGYVEDIVDETEFILLYDANKSREIYPYWNFKRFDLQNFVDAQCLTDFRIRKNDIFHLKECLQLKTLCAVKEVHASQWKDCIYI